jgi:ribonuclease E
LDDGEASGETDRGPRAEAEADDGDDARQRKRRRGRRGGRRGRRGRSEERGETMAENGESEDFHPAAFAERSRDDIFADPYEIDTTPVIEEKPQAVPEETASAEDTTLPVPPLAEEHRIGPVAFDPGETSETADEHETVDKHETVADGFGNETPASPAEDEDDDRPKRSGWWQRRSFF